MAGWALADPNGYNFVLHRHFRNRDADERKRDDYGVTTGGTRAIAVAGGVAYSHED